MLSENLLYYDILRLTHHSIIFPKFYFDKAVTVNLIGGKEKKNGGGGGGGDYK